MIRIIDGKRYNSETAEEICFAGNNLNPTDFRNLNAWLFRTEKGAWFIHGVGGASSRFSHNTGNGRCGAEDLQVVTAEDAQAFLEARVPHEPVRAIAILEKYFQIQDA